MSQEPERLGAHLVRGILGVGATARVFRVSDPNGGPDLALKLLHPEVAASEEARRRFRREVELAKSIDHQAVPRVRGQGEWEGSPWVVMELVEGDTFEQLLEGGPLPWREVVQRGLSLTEALSELHERGIVHRDVKPANVVVDDQDQLRLIDLGLATTLQPDGEATSVGSRAGTPRYMSPEQALGRSVLPSSDLYSVALCLFEALTGESPYQATTEAALLAAHVHARPKSLPRGTAPPALDVILASCLAKSPEQRHGSARELAADFRALLADEALAPGATIAGRRLGLRRLRGFLPGRSREMGSLRRWLRSIAAGRAVPPLVLKGPPGSGRTALLEWAAADALQLGIVVSRSREATDSTLLRIEDDALELATVPPGQALLLATNPATPITSRARVLELQALGSGAIRRWIKDELGLSQVDARDLAFAQHWSGGWPGRLEPLLFRWNEALRCGAAPARGELASLLEAGEEERKRTASLLDGLEEESRLMIELLAWLHPARVEAASIADAAGLDEAGLERSLGAALRAGLPLALKGGVAGLRDSVVAQLVRELCDESLAPDLIEAAVDLLAAHQGGTELRRRAELLAHGDEREAAHLAVSAILCLREEGQPAEAAQLTEDWVERIDWHGTDEGVELIRLALRFLAEAGQGDRALALLRAAEPRVSPAERLSLRFEEAASQWREGDLPSARGSYLALARDARREKDIGNRFRALHGLASVDWALGRQDRAARHLAALSGLANKVQPSERVDWLRTRGAMALMSGDDRAAEDCLEEAWHSAGAGSEALLFLAEERALLMLQQDRIEEAEQLLGEAIELAKERNNLQRVAYLTHVLGTLYLQAGDSKRGGRTLRAARRAAFRTRHSYLIACNEELLVRVATADADLDEARRRIRLTRKHDPGVPNIEAYMRLAEADLALLEGREDLARERLRAADEILDAIDEEGLLFRRLLHAIALPDAHREFDWEAFSLELSRTSLAFRTAEFRARLDAARVALPPL